MELTLKQYERVRDCLPRQRGNVRVDNLTLLNALLHVLEQGCKWRSLPREFGPWHTIYMRWYRWSKAGVIERVFVRLQQEQILALKLEVISLDSTSIKGHPDGAEAATSRAEDFTRVGFSEVLETPAAAGAAEAKRVVFCTGKVYYDLLKFRDANQMDDTAIVRIEQLYPLHSRRLKELLKPYAKATQWVWCQEESQNMGAWSFVAPLLTELLPAGAKLVYAGRNASASPAVGAKTVHDREQKELVAEAFAG